MITNGWTQKRKETVTGDSFRKRNEEQHSVCLPLQFLECRVLVVADPKTGFSFDGKLYLSQDTNQMENFPVPGKNFSIHNKLILIGFFV